MERCVELFFQTIITAKLFFKGSVKLVKKLNILRFAKTFY